jgi:hypothetical protein
MPVSAGARGSTLHRTGRSAYSGAEADASAGASLLGLCDRQRCRLAGRWSRRLVAQDLAPLITQFQLA